jgi:hypothetical protein
MKTKKTKTAKKYKFSKLQQKWIKTLESGKYNQGRQYLCVKNQDNKLEYCCLGVLCEVYNSLNKENRIFKSKRAATGEKKEIYNYGGLSGILPDQIAYATRLHGDDGNLEKSKYKNLIELNDKYQWSFKKIAAFIKKNPTAVFSND